MISVHWPYNLGNNTTHSNNQLERGRAEKFAGFWQYLLRSVVLCKLDSGYDAHLRLQCAVNRVHRPH